MVVVSFLCAFASPVAGQEALDSSPRGELKAVPEGLPDRTLRVGTKDTVPFAMKENGEWVGISTDLWNELAEELGLEYEWIETDLEGLLTGLESGELDASVAALTLTPEREEIVDFSHPYFESGLGIAIRKGPGSWVRMAQKLLSPEFLRTIGILLLTLLIVGGIVWLFERRRNDQFGGGPRSGLWSGFWWSAVTMTTVGYGDKAPVTTGGRIVALIWMFVGLVAISSLTAAITSSLTVSQLGSDISGPADLEGVTVGTVESSTSIGYLERRGINYRAYPNARTALERLESEEVEAVVYDMPILVYMTRTDFEGLTTTGAPFERQSYAIALPEGSEMREELNRRLLDLIRDDEWRAIRTRYLGESKSQ